MGPGQVLVQIGEAVAVLVEESVIVVFGVQTGGGLNAVRNAVTVGVQKFMAAHVGSGSHWPGRSVPVHGRGVGDASRVPAGRSRQQVTAGGRERVGGEVAAAQGGAVLDRARKGHRRRRPFVLAGQDGVVQVQASGRQHIPVVAGQVVLDRAVSQGRHTFPSHGQKGVGGGSVAGPKDVSQDDGRIIGGIDRAAGGGGIVTEDAGRCVQSATGHVEGATGKRVVDLEDAFFQSDGRGAGIDRAAAVLLPGKFVRHLSVAGEPRPHQVNRPTGNKNRSPATGSLVAGKHAVDHGQAGIAGDADGAAIVGIAVADGKAGHPAAGLGLAIAQVQKAASPFQVDRSRRRAGGGDQLDVVTAEVQAPVAGPGIRARRHQDDVLNRGDLGGVDSGQDGLLGGQLGQAIARIVRLLTIHIHDAGRHQRVIAQRQFDVVRNAIAIGVRRGIAPGDRGKHHCGRQDGAEPTTVSESRVHGRLLCWCKVQQSSTGMKS